MAGNVEKMRGPHVVEVDLDSLDTCEPLEARVIAKKVLDASVAADWSAKLASDLALVKQGEGLEIGVSSSDGQIVVIKSLNGHSVAHVNMTAFRRLTQGGGDALYLLPEVDASLGECVDVDAGKDEKKVVQDDVRAGIDSLNDKLGDALEDDLVESAPDGLSIER